MRVCRSQVVALEGEAFSCIGEVGGEIGDCASYWHPGGYS